jgi:hypothetical protein
VNSAAKQAVEVKGARAVSSKYLSCLDKNPYFNHIKCHLNLFWGANFSGGVGKL